MTDAQWMDRAVFLARRGLGATAPNPAVGAVIVRDGVVLGEGFTHPAGGPHAEVSAITAASAAGHDLAGATMYVTLEPCCHHGRTPPCTDALLAAGIERVVVGIVDPFPPMQGKGLRQLREAGLQVELGVRAKACLSVVRGFVRSITAGLPEVSCKVATSLDGHIATATGESQWITADEARRHGHYLRAEHDALVVGIGTVLADDPSLTCRAREGCDPVPVILDTSLRIPADAKVLHGPRRAVVFCAEDAVGRELHADVVGVARDHTGRLDIEAVLRVLVQRDLHRVLVEGGAEVHRALLDRRLVDTLYVYIAPVILPGGKPWLGGPAVGALSEATRFGPPRVRHLGPDILLWYRLRHLVDAEG